MKRRETHLHNTKRAIPNTDISVLITPPYLSVRVRSRLWTTQVGTTVYRECLKAKDIISIVPSTKIKKKINDGNIISLSRYLAVSRYHDVDTTIRPGAWRGREAVVVLPCNRQVSPSSTTRPLAHPSGGPARSRHQFVVDHRSSRPARTGQSRHDKRTRGGGCDARAWRGGAASPRGGWKNARGSSTGSRLTGVRLKDVALYRCSTLI